MIDINNLTITQARELISSLSGFGAATPENHAYPVGKSVFIRTVTMSYTGQLLRVTAGELVIGNAAWIADSGRWAEALRTGNLNEVEPYPDGDVIVSRASVVDVSPWAHPLPRTTK